VNRATLCTVIASVIAVAVLVTSAGVSAAHVDEDIHGLSYRDNTTLKLGVLPGTGIAYANVDWYITANGNVDVFVDDELVETLSVNGLYIYSALYEPGTQYTVVMIVNSSSVYSFVINVRSVINISDIDPEATLPGDITMTSSQLQIMYTIIGILSGIAVGVPIYYSYRRRRELNKNMVVSK